MSKWSLLYVDQTFRHFNVRSPRVFDERDGDAKLRHLSVGTIQLDALGFELLCERLKVFDLEADVIDRSAGRADGRRRRRREVQENARQLILNERGPWIGRKHLRAECLRVPRLHLGVHLAEEVYV